MTIKKSSMSVTWRNPLRNLCGCWKFNKTFFESNERMLFFYNSFQYGFPSSLNIEEITEKCGEVDGFMSSTFVHLVSSLMIFKLIIVNDILSAYGREFWD